MQSLRDPEANGGFAVFHTCLLRSPTGSLSFSQQEGEKTMEEFTWEIFMGPGLEAVSLPLTLYCLDLSQWLLLTAKEAGKCSLVSEQLLVYV